MQALFPAEPIELSRDDLVELYAYPSEQTWLRTNFVASVDGAAQGSQGRSGGLSSPADQMIFALLRSLTDVILVGGQTARVEGYLPVQLPEIDVELRAQLGLTPTPAIAIVSRQLDFDPAVLAGGEAPTIVVTTADAAERHADVLADATVVDAGRPGDPVHVDSVRIVEELVGLGYQRILCEGGPSLHYGLLANGQVDELCLTVTPQLVGGDPARIVTSAPYFDSAIPLELRHLLTEDGDLFCRYTVTR